MPLGIDRRAFDALSPEDRALAEKHLASIAQAAQANPLNGYFPSAPQKKVLESRTKITAAFAGNRFGKTCVGAIKCIINAIDAEDVPEHLREYKKWDVKKHGPIHVRIIAPDFKKYIESVILEELRKWIPKHTLLGESWDKAYVNRYNRLYFKNGSYFTFHSYEQDLDKLGGDSCHMVWYDEEPPQLHRNECLMRLVQHRGDEVFTVTPLNAASGWLEQVIWKRRHEKHITVVKGASTDNPLITQEAIEEIKGEFPEEEWSARLYGDFVSYAGRIYPTFNERDHKRPAVAPPDLAAHEIVVGIDPGIGGGFGVVWCAFDNEDNIFVFDEWLERDAIVLTAARTIHARNRMWGIDPNAYIIDPASAQRSVITGANVADEFRRHGIFTRKGNNDFDIGVNQIRTLLQHKNAQGGLAPRLVIGDNCPELIDEFLSYHFKQHNDLSKEEPRARAYKRDDHLLDALRYAVLSRYRQDRTFNAVEAKAPDPDLIRVSAPQFHIEQMEREARQAATADLYY